MELNTISLGSEIVCQAFGINTEVRFRSCKVILKSLCRSEAYIVICSSESFIIVCCRAVFEGKYMCVRLIFAPESCADWHILGVIDNFEAAVAWYFEFGWVVATFNAEVFCYLVCGERLPFCAYFLSCGGNC